jgi:hypothetical protein
MLWNRRKVPIYDWDKRWFPEVVHVTAGPAATTMSWTAPEDCYRDLVSVLATFVCDTSTPLRRFNIHSMQGSHMIHSSTSNHYHRFDGTHYVSFAHGHGMNLPADYPNYTLNVSISTPWHILPGDVLHVLAYGTVLTDHFVDMAITCKAWYL